ncbi:hypothetical protein BU15DRAFT_82927 [Melanogaster broomeanus]|nr:hypothetical protein BU15DRAFT_82927 [Melanogaster broomeanus]
MSDLAPATSVPKHKCLPSEADIIHLSDIGRHFQTFPKGTFSARLAPPTLPLFVAHYYAAHPLYWQWTTKDGPNAAKTFKVPTVPTHCPKGFPKASLLQGASCSPVTPGAAPSTLNLEKAVLRSPAMSPPPSTHPISNDTSLVKSLKALYALAISQITALEVELEVFRSNPQATSGHPIPSVGTLLTSAAPSLNPFTLAAGLIPAAKQPTRAQPVCKSWVRGTARPTGPTHPTT